MGVSRSVPELQAKLKRFSAAQQNVRRVGVRNATAVMAASIDAELVAATGDRRLSGVGKNGARLGIKTVIGNDKASLSATGPWQLVEGDTKKHDISPRGRRVGKRGRPLKGAQALKIGGGFYASAKATGGSKGKEPWAKGTIAGRPLAAKAFDAAEAAALREVFR